MTQRPFTAADLRGAVDLSALSSARPPAGAPGAASAGTAQGAGSGAGPSATGAAAPASAAGQSSNGVFVQASDATFNALVSATVTVPAVMVLWASQVAESAEYLDELVAEAVAREGRFRVIGVEITQTPGIMQALSPVLAQVFGKVEGLPIVVGILQGQPMPFYVGPVPMDQVSPLLDKFLAEAVTSGVTGRADVSAVVAAAQAGGGTAEGDAGMDGDEVEPPLPPLHEKAFDAIERGDLAGAAEAYREALAEQPTDEDARLGLGQVELMLRTQDLDAAQVRRDAAERPTDVTAQTQAADLDMVGGHVEDALSRLVDAVRATSGDDRDVVRTHLLGLFEVLGASDPRVSTARKALMSALF